MTIGDVVAIKGDSRILGEITAIDDFDRVTVKLNDSGVEIAVWLDNLCYTRGVQPHIKSGNLLHILGTAYKIIIVEEGDCNSKGADGWCDPQAKEILLYNYKQDVDSVRDLVAYQSKVLRHEIIHAFLYESGLYHSSCSSNCWAMNEEMVDWLAIQEPKIHKAFEEAGCDG